MGLPKGCCQSKTSAETHFALLQMGPSDCPAASGSVSVLRCWAGTQVLSRAAVVLEISKTLLTFFFLAVLEIFFFAA